MITYDYEPSESPADLAFRVDLVARPRVVSRVSVDGDWIILELGSVEVLQDHRREGAAPTVVSIYAGGVGLPGGPPSVDDLSGIEVLVFAHEWDAAPGGLVADIQGLWLACGDTGPAVSVVVTPLGEDWQQATTLGALQDAIPDGDVPAGEVIVRVDQGDGWRLIDTEPGRGSRMR